MLVRYQKSVLDFCTNGNLLVPCKKVQNVNYETVSITYKRLLTQKDFKVKSRSCKKCLLLNRIATISSCKADFFSYNSLQHNVNLSHSKRAMELEYVTSDPIIFNDTGFVSNNFIRENQAVAIPYLTLLCIFTVSGSLGNTMVVGAVLTYKVIFFFYLKFFYTS